MALLSFFDDFALVILILLVLTIYSFLKRGWAPSSAVALIVTIVVALLVLVPYVWFRYVLFVVLILGAGLSMAKPKEWFK